MVSRGKEDRISKQPHRNYAGVGDERRWFGAEAGDTLRTLTILTDSLNIESIMKFKIIPSNYFAGAYHDREICQNHICYNDNYYRFF
jgi:hypothetical protein